MGTKLTRRDALFSAVVAAAGASLPEIAQAEQHEADPKSLPVKSARSQFEPVCVADYEALAKGKLSHVAWEYYNSGSADEVTMRWNRESLTNVRLRPRAMVDVSKIDTRMKLLGEEMAHPILLAPTSSHILADPEGEVATVRGAGAADATMVISTLSNRSVEDIARAASRPVWFQLYVDDDRGLTKELVQRAESAGARALCITVDLPWVYARTREAHIHDESPVLPFPNVHMKMPVGTGMKSNRSASFNWKDLEWIRSFAKTPVLVKGILNADDADTAVKAGVAGVVVSNHGGRALDTVPATIDALPGVVERVAGRVPVLMDGGIRRGTDVLKALARGANAVLVGRPYLYGLGVAGSDGVRHVIEILREELQAAMALTGRRSIGEIDRTVLW
jgi:4-hydroxymandelate oxidase